MAIPTIISLVLMLVLVIFVHKLGHFVVWRALPGAAERQDLDLSLAYTPVWGRIVIVLAGPAANLLLAVLLFWGFLTFVGRPVFQNTSTTVGLVMTGFPAAAAGIRVGDRIVAVNGEMVGTWEDLAQRVQPLAGRRGTLTVERDGKRFEAILSLRVSTREEAASQTLTLRLIGIGPAEGVVYHRDRPLTALVEAARQTAGTIGMMLMGFGQMVAGASAKTTIGPILVDQMRGLEVRQEFLKSLIFLTAYLSISLGALNLLPLPFLDGARLCFLLVEGIRGRPVGLDARRKTQWFVVLLFVAVTILALSGHVLRWLKNL